MSVPQSLPPFAAAFGAQSLSPLPAAGNALPPLVGRKRSASPAYVRLSHPDALLTIRSPDSPDIKEEQDHDPDPLPEDASTVPSPLKKRRVTVSGAQPSLSARPLTDSAPMSPGVMTFPTKRDTAPQHDQPRPSAPAKQKQKSLIDQHRGSISGVTSPANSLVNTASSASSDDRISSSSSSKGSATAPLSRSMRRSPNTVSAIRRPSTNVASSGTRPPSPTSLIGPPQQPLSIAARTSFARRRAAHMGPGKKPADLLISPRDSHTADQRPVIQSAPPIPDGGQGVFYTDRAPIALPRLPSVMNSGDNIRRVATNVPPTPTRLSLQPRQQPPPPTPQIGLTGRPPSAASIPIATTLVPPTPSALHHPGYSGDRAAFLAPFEMFYDALNDSKELKKWLSEQLQKSNSLMQSLAQQQEKLHEVVETLVERRVACMQSEISGLQRRVAELEEALRQATSGSGGSRERHHRNGTAEYQQLSSAESSTRTKADSVRTGPSWGQEREIRENHEGADADMESPGPFGARTASESSFTRNPSQGYRDSPGHHLPPPSAHSKTSRGSGAGRSPKLAHLTSCERGAPPPHG